MAHEIVMIILLLKTPSVKTLLMMKIDWRRRAVHQTGRKVAVCLLCNQTAHVDDHGQVHLWRVRAVAWCPHRQIEHAALTTAPVPLDYGRDQQDGPPEHGGSPACS
jgi:hypothetical protein